MLGLVAAMLTLAAAPQATAMPILDQSFTTPDNLQSAINAGCKYIAQSFTVGVAGMLTGVNIDVLSNDGAPPLRVVIRHSSNNRPLGPPLGTRSLADPDAPLSRLIAFDEDIPIFAGEHYAIQVNYRGAELGQQQGGWDGDTGNYYLGGRSAGGECPNYGGTTFWHLQGPSDDLHFRTYVDPAP